LIETSNGALNIHNKSELISSYVAQCGTKPNEIFRTDVEIMNPGMTGTFSYIFTLMTIDGDRFGDLFTFTFSVKSDSRGVIPVGNHIVQWNGYRNPQYQGKRFQ